MSETTPTTPHFERDATTGLVKGVEYKFKPDGKIDYRAMLNPAHIVFNAKNEKVAAEIEKTYGAPAKSLVYSEVVKKQAVDDKHILVLLAGWLELAELRGFTRSVPTLLQVGNGIVAVGWEIDWIPNCEEPQGKTEGDGADATLENTGGFGYLTTMAMNRARSRVIRRSLGVNIMSYDEVDKAHEAAQEAGATASAATPAAIDSRPVPTLIRYCKEANLAFDVVKAGALDRYRAKMESDPSTWTQFEDVPARDCLTLIGIIKDRTKGKTAKAA
jgi:hypothetical protein